MASFHCSLFIVLPDPPKYAGSHKDTKMSLCHVYGVRGINVEFDIPTSLQVPVLVALNYLLTYLICQHER
jgi:hypothetical protein